MESILSSPFRISAISAARARFHKHLTSSILTVSEHGVPSNADKSSNSSIQIAMDVFRLIGGSLVVPKSTGQTAGANFETITRQFVEDGFGVLRHLRPGTFEVKKGAKIAEFEQYAHLAKLDELSRAHRELKTILGEYTIKPDVVIIRSPEEDDTINNGQLIVDDQSSQMASLRLKNNSQPILHASISCKWTIRSDRAQNAQTEALNLIRNRKGRSPHIVAVTAEPLPTRIASIALGTGDIDCVYHFALDELQEALKTLGKEEQLDMLYSMTAGNRLRDISDLPLDLVT